jgi:hypothetical protein
MVPLKLCHSLLELCKSDHRHLINKLGGWLPDGDRGNPCGPLLADKPLRKLGAVDMFSVEPVRVREQQQRH